MKKKIYKFLITYKQFFSDIRVADITIYYFLKIYYLKLIKYIYIFCYWYFMLLNYSHNVLLSFVLNYILLNSLNNWVYFWGKVIRFFLLKVTKGLVKTYFYITPFRIFYAAWLLKFLRVKLLYNYSVKNIIVKIMNQLFDNYRVTYQYYFVKGIKFCVSGRFTRADRKLFWWKSQGFLGQSNVNGWLEYAATTVLLLNSKCGLKLWLRKEPVIIKQHYLVNQLKYTYKKKIIIE